MKHKLGSRDADRRPLRRARGLALRDPALFQPQFGIPAEEMIARARSAGLDPALLEDDRLSLDVDRPQDYELALARL